MDMNDEAKAKVITDIMEEVHKNYKETPLETDDLLIKKMQSSIESKGFNFYPHAIIKALDAEAERQFQSMLTDLIKGVPPVRLNAIKDTIIKWYNEEEERFDAYKNECIEKKLGVSKEREDEIKGLKSEVQLSFLEEAKSEEVVEKEVEKEVVEKEEEEVKKKVVKKKSK